MAVLFGDKKTKDGWIRVTCIQYQMEAHENGHVINAEEVPDYPVPPRGKKAVQYYHPEKKEWKYDMVDSQWSQEEVLLELVDAVRELTIVLKERK
jgi:hypothetical protein